MQRRQPSGQPALFLTLGRATPITIRLATEPSSLNIELSSVQMHGRTN